MTQSTHGTFKIIGGQVPEMVSKRYKFMQPEHKIENNTKRNLNSIMTYGERTVDVKD